RLVGAEICIRDRPRPGAARPRGEQAAGQGKDGGTMIIAVGGDADGFYPPVTINATSAQVSSMVFEHLAEPGDQLNVIGDAGWHGRLASSWTWGRDSLSLAFHLDPKARWHDGPPVRASDVAFTYQLYTDPKVGSDVAPLLENIDSVTTPDSLTAVFWFKRRSPQQFFDAAFQMRILPAHLLEKLDRREIASSEFARHPVGSGPYRFARWVPRQTIELVADTTYHRGRPHIDRLIWSIAPDPNAVLLRLLSGDADVVEFLRPSDFATLASHPELKVVEYPSLIYGYFIFNEVDPAHPSRPHPLFGDRAMRRALTMAIDRRQLVRSVFDTLADAAVGPVTHALPSYDSTIAQLPYAPDSAKHLLDAMGWRPAGKDSVRVKNGRALRFTIVVPSSSTPRVRMAVLMQQMFAAVGAKVDVEQVDFPTHGQRLATKQFDATIFTFASDGTPSAIRQTWSTAAADAKDGNNYASYRNPRFDALIDSASAQMDTARANAYYRRAYEMLNQDAAAIWLFEPLTFAGMHKRIMPVGLRADAWFANIDQWYIPASQRIARDRIGLALARP
ncbi:MAG: peptide ABC transporter substrate-binding protein, partial [Gemmatimonadaceae bacterium]|nr:peptide ABC transporter substrate-binding protein [Gemmatimonadaceae bacterium]